MLASYIRKKRIALRLCVDRAPIPLSRLADIGGVPPIRAGYGTHGQDAHATV
jgi:hypothetical protein